jgi:hypothetical protein
LNYLTNIGDLVFRAAASRTAELHTKIDICSDYMQSIFGAVFLSARIQGRGVHQNRGVMADVPVG